MSASVLPVSNVINVTIAQTPSGLTAKNVNSLALFTTDRPNNLNPFGVYLTAAQVGADYGTTSDTYQMALALFSQSPNILSGSGRLVIIPLINSTQAKHGSALTPNIAANLAALIAVSNGNLKVTVNGVINNLANLNFTNCVTLADIATVLQGYLVDVTVSATASQITFTSKKVGALSTVVLGLYAGGGIDLSGAAYFNAAGSTLAAGVNSTGETILAAIARTSGQIGYVPCMTTMDLEDAAVIAIAAGIQAMDNMFFHHCASTTDIAGIGTTISQASETRTRVLLYTTSQYQAKLMKAAYAGRACSVDFTGSNTSSTMNLRSLATIVSDPGITQTLYAAANIAGVDVYVSYDGVPGVYSTEGNDFFDNPYSDLALKFALETAGFNYLRQTNTKVPQTEPGMNGLKAAYNKVMKQFVTCGEIAPGQWTGGDTFNDPVIFNNNITAQGYYIYSQPVAQQNTADRNARKAPIVQMAFKRAGAIQSGNVFVEVNN